MRTGILVLLCAFVLSGVAVAEDKSEAPAKAATPVEPQVDLTFKDAAVLDILKKLASEAGYGLFVSRHAQTDTKLTLAVGQVSLEEACQLVGMQAGFAVRVHSSRKLIEALYYDNPGALARAVVLPLAGVNKAFHDSVDALGPLVDEGEIYEFDTFDYEYALELVIEALAGCGMNEVSGYIGPRHFSGLVTDQQLVNVRELMEMLATGSNGTSRWLLRQASIWAKLSAARLTLESESAKVGDLAAQLSKQLDVPVILHSGVDRDTKVSIRVKDAPAVESVQAALEAAGLRLTLSSTCVVVSSAETSVDYWLGCSYALYELGQLAKARAASSEAEDVTPWTELWMIQDEVAKLVDGVHSGCAMFGGVMVVRGDAWLQARVKAALVDLGWEE